MTTNRADQILLMNAEWLTTVLITIAIGSTVYYTGAKGNGQSEPQTIMPILPGYCANAVDFIANRAITF
jgi:hypothetical protein